jgi:phytoene dehydrogenase-like protein
MSDAVVIGGGAEGLAAAALLAAGGLKTLLLERSSILPAQVDELALGALDPKTIKTLKLARHGLAFAVRDMSLTVPGSGGATAVLARDRHATAKSLDALSPADAAAYEPWRRELFALARALRPLWWERAGDAALTHRQRDLFERLKVMSANAWLATRFESDALRAALAFDAAAAGAPPSEAGSALALCWRAAQEMSGAQGALAIPRGGASGLVNALAEAAQKAGVEIRTGADVTMIAVAGGAAAGVELAGETIAAPLVLSTLPRRQTLRGLLPAGETGLDAAHALSRPSEDFGCATLRFDLNRLPDFGFLRGAAPTRYVLAERPESYETALAAARLGRPAPEPVLEAILPPPEPAMSGVNLQLTVRAWPVLATEPETALIARVTAQIERYAPGFSAVVAHADVMPPGAGPSSASHMLAPAGTRIATPVRGLYLCGADAEPASGLSLRAARQAAEFAIAQHRKARVP